MRYASAAPRPFSAIFALVLLAVGTFVMLSATAGDARAETRPNDPLFRWGHQWGLEKIRAPLAWDVTAGSSSVVIAILDTGVDEDHPDLAAKLVPGTNTKDGGSTDDDDYSNGHGSMMAGIAAAVTNNNVGMAGVSWGSVVMPVKVCGSAISSCWTTDLAEGITWATNHGADIIQVIPSALGSSELQSAVNYAVSRGVIVVAAVGNTTVRYPAAYAGVIGVGATDEADTVTSWSARGTGVDVTAPGVNIYGTTNTGNYAFLTSTTAASAHVTGVLSLLLAAGATSAEAVDCLYESAVDRGAAGWDSAYGWGRVDAYGALLACGFAPGSTPVPTATRTPAPTATRTPTRTPTRTATPVPPTPTPTASGDDRDGDGCSNARELGQDETLGGRRDPDNRYDFFDVPLPPGAPGTGSKDRVISLEDIMGVIAKVGTLAGGPANPSGQVYNPDFDRTYLGPEPWDLGPPNGAVDVSDVLFVINQFGHSCR